MAKPALTERALLAWQRQRGHQRPDHSGQSRLSVPSNEASTLTAPRTVETSCSLNYTAALSRAPRGARAQHASWTVPGPAAPEGQWAGSHGLPLAGGEDRGTVKDRFRDSSGSREVSLLRGTLRSCLCQEPFMLTGVGRGKGGGNKIERGPRPGGHTCGPACGNWNQAWAA